MAKGSNIVHQYFRKEFDDFVVLVRVNPFHLEGVELTIPREGTPEIRELEFDSDIFEDLKADGFKESSPLEFNLYYSGLA
ncbi:MAG TPA: hypothetical protein VEB86_05110 [Chryseosolibacter sp.]|nr:hypothetical protein [Chryseosolibacter sp.]